MKSIKNSIICSGLLVPIMIIFIWWLGSNAFWWNTFLLPSPTQTASAFFSYLQNGELQKHVCASLSRIIKGFGLSAVIALSLALLCSQFPALLTQIEPTLEFFRHIPPMSVIPLLILWFGIGESPKIILIILATFFPVFLNTLQGIKASDPKLTEVAKVFGYSHWNQFRFVVLPEAIPSILTGLRLGLGYSWRALVAAELVAAASGLGYMILDAEKLSRSDVVLMGIFVIGALGAFIDYIFFSFLKLSLKKGYML